MVAKLCLTLLVFSTLLLARDRDENFNLPWIGNSGWIEIIEGTEFRIPFRSFLADPDQKIDSWRTEEPTGFINPGVKFEKDHFYGKVTVPESAESHPYQWRFYLYVTIKGEERMLWVFLNIRKDHQRNVQWKGYRPAKNPTEPKFLMVTGQPGFDKNIDLRHSVYNPQGTGLRFKMVSGPSWLTVTRNGTFKNLVPITKAHEGQHEILIHVTDFMSEDKAKLLFVVHE